MAEHQYSEAAVLALNEHRNICMELHTAGFDFIDNGEWLSPSLDGSSRRDSFPSPGQWAVHFQPDKAGDEMLVFNIRGNADSPYGISYCLTPCGKPRFVHYWSGPEDAFVVESESKPGWPGLPAAVLKARRIHQQHKEEGPNA